MKPLTSTFFLLLLGTQAMAGTIYVDATVTKVTPQYVAEKSPEEVCTQVLVRYRQPARNGSGAGTGLVMGGILGALAGPHGAVAGTALGAALGDQEEAQEVAVGAPVPVYERHCETEWREVRQRVLNYRIEVEYQGNRYLSYENYIPGPTMRIPVENNSK